MLRFAVLFAALLALSACQNSEERAEGHYQSALALLADGDLERATVEFRNVFDLNGLHVEARRTFAQALRDDGDIPQSYGQFLRLVEQLPDDVTARIALAEMAIEAQNWGQLQIHGQRLLDLVPEDMRTGEDGTRIEVIATTLAYAEAIEAEDAPARRAAAAAAADLAETMPNAMGLYRVLVDNALRDGDTDSAAVLVDRALAVAPDNRDLHNTRLALLAGAEDIPGVRTQLEDMIARYPDDDELVATLLRFHISQGDSDAAETFLRNRIATADGPAMDLRATLVQFLLRTQGSEAALAELEEQIAVVDDDHTLRMIRATVQFAAGEREGAIAQVEELIEAQEIATGDANDAKVVLAGMYVEIGNPVGARRLVGEVLETDPGHDTALRLEAGWLIDDDRADDAIALLRRALDEAPDNAQAMTLMARAHTRNGNRELARDFLSLAFEASNAAPDTTLRYADDLARDELYLAAEDALITALRLQPSNLELLDRLGQIYIAMEDWARAEQVEDTARRQGTADGDALANGIRLALLNARGQSADALAFLEDLVDGDNAQTGLAAQLAVVGRLLTDGDSEGAVRYLTEALAAEPDNVALLMARGAAERAGGDIAAAIATYATITQNEPGFERAWIELIRSEAATGDAEAARATLERALAELPDGVNLLWAQASFLEQAGDFDGAIAIYESLYAELPDSPVVANNLASLISTHRTGAEDLERAYAIARRLRGTDVAPLMDTYGWITFRRGDIEEARPYLEGAAAALTQDPLVQVHYGMLLSAAGETEAATAQLTRALDMIGPEEARPQFDIARAELERLQTEAATGTE